MQWLTLSPVVLQLSLKKKVLGVKETKRLNSIERLQSGFDSRHGRIGAKSPTADVRIDIQILIVSNPFIKYYYLVVT